MMSFDEWLEVAERHVYGYGIPSEDHMMLVRMGKFPEFSIPIEARGAIHKAIVMFQKGVVWFDENGEQVGGSAYQGFGEQYIWIGADMWKPKGAL